MARLLNISLPSATSFFKSLHSRPVQLQTLPRRCLDRQFRCTATTQTSANVPVRRSADWQPTLWPDEFIQSLETNHMDETCVKRTENLKVYVKSLLFQVSDPVVKLELVDVLERLGVGYHFKDEIKEVLGSISIENKEDLYSTALLFRILRQHGYKVSQDIFNKFQDESGCFKEFLCHDTKGILSLYEASYLAFENEDTLDEARVFANKHLRNLKGEIDGNIKQKVRHALELPLHWRLTRIEARWFIEWYKKEVDMNPLLLEFAKLDFNSVQIRYRKDLKEISRWWADLGLTKMLSFVRDRVMECYLWAMATSSEPKFWKSRVMVTMNNSLITAVDDIYDIYGSLEELELFTDAFDRWDVKSIEHLPGYMKLCFLAVFNTSNEIRYEILKENGVDISLYLKRMWTDLCKAYLVEAKWYHTKYIPTLKEYLSNGWLSVSTPLILGHAYCCMTQEPTKEELECLVSYPDLIRQSGLIIRLCDDMGTSTAEVERGDVPKSIQCYMHHENVSEAVAREHIKGLISDEWKKFNEVQVSCSTFPGSFINGVLEIVRIAHAFYLHGDGFGSPSEGYNEISLSLVAEPFH